MPGIWQKKESRGKKKKAKQPWSMKWQRMWRQEAALTSTMEYTATPPSFEDQP